MEKDLLMIMRVEMKVHKLLKGFNGVFELSSFFSFTIQKTLTKIIDYWWWYAFIY